MCVPHVDIFDPALLDIKNCSINRFVGAARAAFGESTSHGQLLVKALPSYNDEILVEEEQKYK